VQPAPASSRAAAPGWSLDWVLVMMTLAQTTHASATCPASRPLVRVLPLQGEAATKKDTSEDGRVVAAR
jgi:hypothetical protein